MRCERQRGSVIRAGDLNTENLGSNPQIGLLNLSSVILGTNSPCFVNSTGLPPTSWDSKLGERGRGFLYDTGKPL